MFRLKIGLPGSILSDPKVTQAPKFLYFYKIFLKKFLYFRKWNFLALRLKNGIFQSEIKKFIIFPEMELSRLIFFLYFMKKLRKIKKNTL